MRFFPPGWIHNLHSKIMIITMMMQIQMEYHHPGRKIRNGSGRKAPEITGTWKQYSHRKFFGFFPMISDRFLPESTGNWSEFIGKNPRNFRWEYCFHVPAISGAFLQDPVTFPLLSYRIPRDPVAGIIDLGT